ncbi:plasmid partitioning protein RepB [Rhizobium calliandrae]|uniref:Plasmid partitioning protein RepB n=1 Tax=Rhizobium calliandrae TaxID=1312182 RepID=A0ABT7KC72_9HYPH|nr:plasmid partitioning protein RepB [Rhizobium calliandrae]MDL2406162.1 plasmid partitioning protein RepB [Rhizobium calliandrae]
MSRKDIFANLKPNANPVEAEGPVDFERPLLARTKPMSAVTKSLGDLNDRSRRADDIEKRLAEGQAVVEMDVSQIDPSFVRDRMPGDIDSLVAAIREQGQQVPILVRPHPEHAGRYQVAFGHRRLRAVTELGRPVKAVVRELSDEQLVIAQGQENNERQDLTYIEKARFADQLKARFTRDTIMSALSVQKGDLSLMLSVVARVPAELIEAIGPAPGIGRRSWVDFADYLAVGSNIDNAIEISGSPQIRALPSDERFKAIMKEIKPRSAVQPADDWATPNGLRLGQIRASRSKLDISIDRKTSPEFAAFVLERLPTLFDEFRSKQSDQPKNGE